MQEIITALPNTPIGWIGLILAAIAGGFASYMFYNRTKDGADDRLINILKNTVDQLEKKVNQQTTDIAELTKKVDALEKENETLVKVLQGKDEETQKFYKQAFEAMAVAKTTHELVVAIGESIKATNQSLTKFIEAEAKRK